MIIVRAPHRVSLFGGGADFEDFISLSGSSSVVGFALAKYSYVNIIRNYTNTEHKFRISYSSVENINEIESIKHSIIRETLKYKNIGNYSLHISSMSEIPAGTGLGTSSSFTVALLHALDALKGNVRSQLELARDAVFIERHLVADTGGVQDQYWSAFGGAGKLELSPNSAYLQQVGDLFGKVIQNQAVLISIGETRKSSVQSVKPKAMKTADLFSKRKILKEQAINVYENILNATNKKQLLNYLREQLFLSWEQKKSMISLSSKSSSLIEELEYNQCSFKLLGAGYTGFLFILTKRQKEKRKVKNMALRHDCNVMKVSIDHFGVRRIL